MQDVVAHRGKMLIYKRPGQRVLINNDGFMQVRQRSHSPAVEQTVLGEGLELALVVCHHARATPSVRGALEVVTHHEPELRSFYALVLTMSSSPVIH